MRFQTTRLACSSSVRAFRTHRKTEGSAAVRARRAADLCESVPPNSRPSFMSKRAVGSSLNQMAEAVAWRKILLGGLELVVDAERSLAALVRNLQKVVRGGEISVRYIPNAWIRHGCWRSGDGNQHPANDRVTAKSWK